MGSGRPHGNDPNVLAAPRVDNHEQATCRTHAERDKPLLERAGFIIH
jgi:hypothetical protein